MNGQLLSRKFRTLKTGEIQMMFQDISEYDDSNTTRKNHDEAGTEQQNERD